MPKVPYNPVPSVEPSTQGTPEINVPSLPDAFGANIGQAQQGLGKAIEGAGDELFRRALAIQELDNRAEADNLATEYMLQQGAKDEEFKNLLGRDPKANLEAHNRSSQELREKIGNNISNPAARRLYDSETRRYFAGSVVRATGHAGTQFKSYLVKTNDASLQVIKNEIFADPENYLAFVRGMGKGAERIEENGRIAGDSEATILANKQKFEQDMLLERIRGLGEKDPKKANAFLEANKERLGANLDNAIRSVNTNLIAKGTRIGENQINDDLKIDPTASKKTDQQRMQEADKFSEQYAPGNVMFRDEMRRRVQTGVTQARLAKKQHDWQNNRTVQGAVLTPDSTGKLPTNTTELFANPRVKDAFEQLDEKAQGDILRGLTRNVKEALVVPMTPERQAKTAYFRGLSGEDPIKFLEVDFLKEDLPWEYRDAFIKQQVAMTKKLEDDPRVNAAMASLNSMLVAAKLTNADNPTERARFRGALQDAINIHQQKNKKVPQGEDLQRMGRQLLQKQSGNWFFGETKTFQMEPNSEQRKAILNLDKWRKDGITPTDADIQREFVRMRYQQLYNNAGKPKAP